MNRRFTSIAFLAGAASLILSGCFLQNTVPDSPPPVSDCPGEAQLAASENWDRCIALELNADHGRAYACYMQVGKLEENAGRFCAPPQGEASRCRGYVEAFRLAYKVSLSPGTDGADTRKAAHEAYASCGAAGDPYRVASTRERYLVNLPSWADGDPRIPALPEQDNDLTRLVRERRAKKVASSSKHRR